MRGRTDQPRFEVLLHEHRRIVFKIASVYVRDPHDRDDLAREIAMQLWRRSVRTMIAARGSRPGCTGLR